MTMHIRTPEVSRYGAEWIPALAAVCLLCCSGCQQLFGFTWVRPGSKSPEELLGERELVPLDERDGSAGTLASRMRKMGFRTKNDYRATAGSSLKAAAGREQLAKAQQYYDQKQYPSAEKLAESIAGKFKDSPVREDAIFLMAESQYQQKRYPHAADSYMLLAKEFPSTRYRKTRAKRLFTIARTWLDNTEYVTTGNVELASHDNHGKTNIRVIPNAERKSTKDPTRVIPILPNFHDRSRPMFDTDGRAIEALKSIWQNDPTGPLADDALMLTASYYVRKRNFVEADHIYKILREEYPKSPHAKNAFVLGSFVKRASYQGPAYDGSSLDEAKRLNESTLRLFPNHPERDRIRDDMRKIVEHKAAQEWRNVEFYQRKGRKPAIIMSAKEVIRLYPSSTYADRARQLLRNMRAEAERSRPVEPPAEEPTEPGEPRRLFRLPKFAIPTLPKFGRAKEEIRDSRSDSEKTGSGRVRI